MRTDVKIGIVLGLLVIAGIVAYFFLLTGPDDPVISDDDRIAKEGGTPKLGVPGSKSPSPKPATDPPGDPLAPLSPGPDPVLPSLDPSTPDPVIPVIPVAPGPATPDPVTPDPVIPVVDPPTVDPGTPVVGPDPSEPLAVAPVAVAPGARPGDPGTPALPSGTPGTEDPSTPGIGPGLSEPVIPVIPVEPAGPMIPVTPPPDAEDPGVAVDPGPGEAGPGLVEPAGPVVDPLATTPSQYKIKPGDKLWNIAEQVYGGKGHLWSLIAKANPTMDPTSLRVGAILKIPPAPVDRPRGGSVEPVLDPGQGTLYVVKKGDLGFWQIAEKTYGKNKGHLWSKIAEANPKVKATALRPGQTLVIPPMPTASPRAPGGAAPVDPVALPLGASAYRVEKGDTLQEISRKKYGTTRHWMKIQEANPKVNPKALRIGQTLVIPDIAGGAPAPAPVIPGLIEPAPRDTDRAILPIGPEPAPVPPAPEPEPAPPARSRYPRPRFSTR